MARRDKKSTANLKRYRKLYAKAKRAGLVKGDKDARSLKPSAYMKTKLNKIAPYLTDEYTTVKPSREAFKLYKQTPTQVTPFASLGRVVVKNDPRTKAEVRRGYIARIRRLKNGQMEKVILPITPQDLKDFSRLVKENPHWNDILKVTTDDPDTSENFAFMFFGNPSYMKFGSLEQLAQALENHYLNKIDPEDAGWFTGMGAHPHAPYVEVYREYKDWNMAPVRAENRAIRARERNRDFMRSMSPEQRERRAARRANARQYQQSYLDQLEKRKAERATERKTGQTSEKRQRELEAQRERMRKARAKKKK